MNAVLVNAVPVRRGYADGRFGQIHYRIAKPDRESDADTGKRPLLCFHMSPYSGVIYEKFLSEMGKDRVAIAMDSPGFGNSDPSPDQPTIEDYAGVAKDLLGALDIPSVDVMGYHTGSKVAVQTAIDNPDRVHRVVMVSAPIYTEEDLAEVKRLYGPEPLKEDGSHLQRWWQSAVRWSMEGRSLEDIGRVFWARVLNPAISWWGHAAAFAYDSAAAIPLVTQPVKVLNPEDDVWERTPRAKNLFSNTASHIHDLPGWSHGFLDLKTEETATIVREFLDAE